MEEIYSLAPWQKKYFEVLVLILIAATAVACFYWVYQILQTDVVKAGYPHLRLTFARGSFFLFIFLDVFVWVYSKFFISKIALNQADRTLVFFLGIPGRPKITVPVSEVDKLTFREDDESPLINCYAVRIKGRLLPLVLSAWGVSRNEKLVKEIFHKEDLRINRNPWEGT